MILKVKPIKQLTSEYCGPACLTMIAKFMNRKGKKYTQRAIAEKHETDDVGMSVGELRRCLDFFKIRSLRITSKQYLTTNRLIYYLDKYQLPIICDTEFHFILVIGHTKRHIYIIDPLKGKIVRHNKKHKFWKQLIGYTLCLPTKKKGKRNG